MSGHAVRKPFEAARRARSNSGAASEGSSVGTALSPGRMWQTMKRGMRAIRDSASAKVERPRTRWQDGGASRAAMSPRLKTTNRTAGKRPRHAGEGAVEVTMPLMAGKIPSVTYSHQPLASSRPDLAPAPRLLPLLRGPRSWPRECRRATAPQRACSTPRAAPPPPPQRLLGRRDARRAKRWRAGRAVARASCPAQTGSRRSF
mmetsp:Transcript_50806/g.166010  ORF Transcript_50806/g.166010 Transcript_50806/m.166010 type:complete len:203 (+) Transcript_50806:310-918(+)